MLLRVARKKAAKASSVSGLLQYLILTNIRPHLISSRTIIRNPKW